MIKLELKDPSFAVNGSRVICKLNAIMRDTDTNTVYYRYARSGIALCSPEDDFDEDFGKKLAFSRARQNVYKTAINKAEEISFDSIAFTFFISEMTIYLQKEINHESWILGEPETAYVPYIKTLFIANIEKQLPLIKNTLNYDFFLDV